jgi:hypothetical protein
MKCDWCHEEIEGSGPEDPRRPAPLCASMHEACLIRMIYGGVNHQLGLCSCCGGELPPDDPALSLREAAVAAAELARAKFIGRSMAQ